MSGWNRRRIRTGGLGKNQSGWGHTNDVIELCGLNQNQGGITIISVGCRRVTAGGGWALKEGSERGCFKTTMATDSIGHRVVRRRRSAQ